VNGQQPPPQSVPVSPVPTVILTQQVMGPDGAVKVLMQFSTPVGVGAYFFDPEAAINVGEQLKRAGQAAKAGLFLPGPNGNGPK
jgi:hypothetical protein